MAALTVLTCMNRAILEQTGRAMLGSVVERWPREVAVTVCYEPESAADLDEVRAELGARMRVVDQLADGELVAFLRRYRHHPGQDGFRRCAWRFAYKSFAVTAPSLHAGTDVLIWLDADTFTYRDLPLEQLREWHEGASVVFLGREGSTSECGLVMYDRRDPAVRRMLACWRRLYTTGALLELPEWHDSYVFDHVRRACVPPARQRDLTPWGRGYQHVFVNGPTGAYIDHMKGGRKGGTSRCDDLIPGRCSAEIERYLRERAGPHRSLSPGERP